MRDEQIKIKVEVGIDDLCDILDIAHGELQDELLGWPDHIRTRLLAVLKDLDKQINAGSVQ
jgi:hypothetical protein